MIDPTIRETADRDAKSIGALVVTIVLLAMALGGACAIGVLIGFFLRGSP